VAARIVDPLLSGRDPWPSSAYSRKVEPRERVNGVTFVTGFRTVVHKDPLLRGPEKGVALALASHVNSSRPFPRVCEVWASVTTIAGEAGYSERTVRRALEKLERLGYLSRPSRDDRIKAGRPVVITLRVPAAPAAVSEAPGDMVTHPCQGDRGPLPRTHEAPVTTPPEVEWGSIEHDVREDGVREVRRTIDPETREWLRQAKLATRGREAGSVRSRRTDPPFRVAAGTSVSSAFDPEQVSFPVIEVRRAAIRHPIV
jgi:hypothetical protein